MVHEPIGFPRQSDEAFSEFLVPSTSDDRRLLCFSFLVKTKKAETNTGSFGVLSQENTSNSVFFKRSQQRTWGGGDFFLGGRAATQLTYFTRALQGRRWCGSLPPPQVPGPRCRDSLFCGNPTHAVVASSQLQLFWHYLLDLFSILLSSYFGGSFFEPTWLLF